MHLANEYQKSSFVTSDGVGIIILLYEGIVNFNNLTAQAIEQSDIESRTKYINKSMAIIGELSNALDMERGGVISTNLNRLYTYMAEELIKVNLNNDVSPLKVINRLVLELKEGWDGIKLQQGSNNDYTPAEAEAGQGSVSARF